jgi:hypothetical protein
MAVSSASAFEQQVDRPITPQAPANPLSSQRSTGGHSMDEEIYADENQFEDTIEMEEVESEDTEEYEEIDSDEVDRVVTALEELSGSINSENIRHLIEEASNSIYYLVYSEDEEEDEEDNLLEEAA